MSAPGLVPGADKPLAGHTQFLNRKSAHATILPRTNVPSPRPIHAVTDPAQSADRPSTPWLPVLAALFFTSGATSLLFQVLWTRLLANIVGTTAVAMTCVFGVFIVCMSVGAAVASRVEVFGKNAVRVYGLLELVVGATGFGLTVLLLEYGTAIAQLLEALPVSGSIGHALFVTVLLIGLPTSLMGATLPMILNGIKGSAEASTDLPRRQVTRLYGLNLLGGATGALACGFLLIWQLGVVGSGLFALATNALVAAVAFGIAPKLEKLAEDEREGWKPSPQTGQDAPTTGEHPSRGYEGWKPSPQGAYHALAFISGMTALQYELLWGRLAKFLLGDRTMATSALLFIYLSCLAIGSLEARRIDALRRKYLDKYLGSTGFYAFWGALVAVAALGHLLGVRGVYEVVDGDFLAFLVSGRGDTMGRVLVTFLLACVPVTILGVAFPYLMYSARELNDLPGRTVGRLYFVNSVGSAVGAVLGGYFLPRWIGTLPAFGLTSAFLLGVAVLCVALPGRDSPQVRPSRRTRSILAAVAAALVMLAAGLLALPSNFHFYPEDAELLDAHEDEYGIQLMTETPEGHLNVKNNEIYIAYKLGPRITNWAQASISWEACTLARRCERVINVGTGWGITAGAFTLFDAPEQVTTVEVLPYLYRHQADFAPENYGYVDDPRVERLLGDGRRVLTFSDRPWDVISVNVLDPYLPGSSGLFTTDFWRMARSRLSDGGVYAQLIWGPDVPLLARGLQEVFGTVLFFPAYKNAYNAIAFAEEVDLSKLQPHHDRMTERLREALADMDVDAPREHFARMLRRAAARADRQAAKADPDQQLHTDNWPVLEFRWSQGYEGVSMFDSLQALEYE